jgi:uncharacterized membrane protein
VISPDRKATPVLVASVILMGLLAGLLYAFVCAVMPALADSSASSARRRSQAGRS